MDNIDLLKSLLSANQSDRLAKEKAAQDRIDDPRLPRHTVYKGDRKIQQLGQDTIENGLIINNQSVAIGDVMLPLAKGNVLRRVDNTNGGALLGTAYRDALENDFDANGDRRETELGRNGGQEPSDPNNPNKPRKPNDRVPPPFGCVPPPSQCFWSSSPDTPDGFQNYGDAVVNENAQPVYLYCVPGTSVPANLGCDFLNQKWSCSAGVCSLDPNGIYSSLAACEAALIPPPFTGGQCVGVAYRIQVAVTYADGTFYATLINANLGQSATPLTDATMLASGKNINGAISTVDFGTVQVNGKFVRVNGIENDGTSFGFATNRSFGTLPPLSISVYRIVRADGSPDTCGDLPSTCPI